MPFDGRQRCNTRRVRGIQVQSQVQTLRHALSSDRRNPLRALVGMPGLEPGRGLALRILGPMHLPTPRSQVRASTLREVLNEAAARQPEGVTGGA